MSKTILFLTFFLTSYVLWFVSSDYIDKTDVNNLSKTQERSLETSLDFSDVEEVYSIVKKEFYDIEGIEKQVLIDGMSKWLVDALWDKHSEFFNTQENEDFASVLSWDFEWIGAVVEMKDFWVKVERTLKWSPSEKYWVLKDDIIIEADNESLSELSLTEAVAKIKGPAGTPVILTILRQWEDESLKITVIRDEIKIPSIEEKYFEEEKIWYIALNLYWEDTAKEFKKALSNLEQKETNGLIIDIRSNSWWYLRSAVEILSEFIDDGALLVTTKYKDTRKNDIYRSSHSWNSYDKKIVVLINGSSASASEITSAALREYDKAILVWEKTYGKWSVQQPFELDDWSMLKLTIAKWYTPLDKSIDKEWIEPDILVEFKKEDYNFEACIESGRCEAWMEQEDFEVYDRQLEEAKTILQSFIKKWNIQFVIDSENERLWNIDEEGTKQEEKNADDFIN